VHRLRAEPGANDEFKRNIDFYRERIVMRTQEISNHPSWCAASAASA
jgi:acyl-CoA hydrolase